MMSKNETLESQLVEKDSMQAEKLRTLSTDHENKTTALTKKLDMLKSSFEVEKLRIE